MSLHVDLNIAATETTTAYQYPVNKDEQAWAATLKKMKHKQRHKFVRTTIMNTFNLMANVYRIINHGCLTC